MEPTPKAIELAKPVGDILSNMRTLRGNSTAFDPRTSMRTFQFCVVDAGIIKLLPPLVNRVLAEAPRVRRQFLWLEEYVGVVHRGHSRLSTNPSLREFAAENHVLVSTPGTGHAHKLAEQAVEAAIPPENIICRVPIFIAAAIIAKHTNAVATLPMSIATVLAEDLDLEIIRPPIKLPKIEIFQYWHNRIHHEPANKWIRSVFASLFRAPGSHPRA